jgi:uncharacterized protein (TIGR04222 family)
MNVFDLRGPQFLIFYAGFGLLMFWAARWLRHLADPSPSASSKADDDPYVTACLRGGGDEAIRVSIVSLVDRGLLAVAGSQLRNSSDSSGARRPLERAILRAAGGGADAALLVKDAEVRRQANLLGVELAAQGYWARPRFAGRRLVLYVVCAYLCAWVALHKIALALERGRTNIEILIGSLLVLCVALLFAVFPRRTHAGERRVRDLKRIFARVYDERAAIQRGGASTELVWLAAVYGLAALPEPSFPALYQLFPRAKAHASSSSSSCGASSCSGGSSCGGGGGCGGCGGGGD